ncbi:MAG: riboflavin synthase [Dehalococcoidia bacterium]|nr:riboflavin synthase [Dehalococcoidia bacterium]
MFTGIVEEIGLLKEFSGGRLTISAGKVLEGTNPGDSISVNGACLTVTSLSKDSFTIEVMPETLRRTNLGRLQSGDPVNLERALTLAGRIGGHLVQGHVDGTGQLLSLARESSAILVRYSAPGEIGRYIVEKGFIAVDGISLTVVSCDATSFVVSLVGYTRHNTNLGSKNIGAMVNLEADIVAKYIEKLLQPASTGVTLDFLAEHGFVHR